MLPTLSESMLQYTPGVPNSYQILQNVSKRFVVKVPLLDIECKREAEVLTVDSMPVLIDFVVGRYYDDGQLIADQENGPLCYHL